MYYFIQKEWKSKWITVKTTFASVKKTNQVVETFKATVSKLHAIYGGWFIRFNDDSYLFLKMLAIVKKNNSNNRIIVLFEYSSLPKLFKSWKDPISGFSSCLPQVMKCSREKSGNFTSSQGKLKSWKEVRESEI